mmetsp:Transcript_22376/g.62022  ORF Transcript_22376/g.62022 Transcript_22376/m.62022 type:complete len:281 (-) Transcript_22376:575-1417(-)
MQKKICGCHSIRKWMSCSVSFASRGCAARWPLASAYSVGRPAGHRAPTARRARLARGHQGGLRVPLAGLAALRGRHLSRVEARAAANRLRAATVPLLQRGQHSVHTVTPVVFPWGSEAEGAHALCCVEHGPEGLLAPLGICWGGQPLEPQSVGCRRPQGRIALQQRAEERDRRGRDPRGRRTQAGRGLEGRFGGACRDGVLHGAAGRVPRLVRELAAREEVHSDAQGPDVRLRAVVMQLEHLGGHERRCAIHAPELGAAVRQELRSAEVAKLHSAVLAGA